MSFPGSKGGAGVAQWIINQMPPHRVYCEPFLGRGVILNTKRPADLNIGIDYDAGVIADFERRHPQPKATIVYGNSIELLRAFRVESDWLIYADPPYLMEALSCKRKYYRQCELAQPDAHNKLLSILSSLPGMVIISGYASSLYADRLAGWRVSSFWTVNARGRRVQEFVWMNFPPPALLHDTRFIGSNFIRRQGFKRKVARWKSKFLAMPAAERQGILDTLMSARELLDKKDRSGSCSRS